LRCIAIITGSRGEYGYIRPILHLIEKDPDLDYKLIITNMHLLPSFGLSVKEIEEDGFEISDRIYMALDGYTPATMTKSLAGFLWSFVDVLSRLSPDILLLAGDRGEQLMAAIAAAHMNIPIAHIQAGEVSGHIDGQSRHAIARFSHIHFASNEDAAQRLLKSGEQEFRIHKTGAPQLDELVRGSYDPPQLIGKEIGIDLDSPMILMVQHPTSEEYDKGLEQIRETYNAILGFEYQTIIVFPNNDACNDTIRIWIEANKQPFIKVFRNLPRSKYLGLMNIASVLVGNSSSGLIEAPTFNLPVVNIGERQRGRAHGANVINVPAKREKIREAIKRALNPEFLQIVHESQHPYLGDGNVSERIVKVLKEISIDDNLIKKGLTY